MFFIRACITFMNLGSKARTPNLEVGFNIVSLKVWSLPLTSSAGSKVQQQRVVWWSTDNTKNDGKLVTKDLKWLQREILPLPKKNPG